MIRTTRPLLLAIAIAPVSPVVAQQGRDATRTLDELAACRSISADAQRLSCFDRIAAGIAGARASGDLLVFDRKKVEEERRTRFGLVDPPAGGTTPEGVVRVREVATTVKAVRPAPQRNHWTVDLANGQTWRTLESTPEPRVGAPIRLVTTVTGGFRAVVGKGRLFDVRRIR